MSQQPPQNQPKLVGKKPEIIVRARITEVEAKKHKDGPVAGMEIQMDFEKVAASGNFLEVWFLYRAEYKHDIGYIQMRGLVLLEMTEKRVARIAEAWNTNKEMDSWMAQALLQNINYKCGSEAMLAGKLIDLPSPIVPPPVGISAGPEPAAQPQPAAAKPQGQQPPAQQPMQSAPARPAPPPSQPPVQQTQPPGARPFMPSFNTPFTGRKPN